MASQVISGFFRRAKSRSLCKMELFFNLPRLFNIAETVEGANGIWIDKPTNANGFGWRIRLTAQIPAAKPPELWDWRVSTVFPYNTEVYCGDGSQAWGIDCYGSEYFGDRTGWCAMSSGKWYITKSHTASSFTLNSQATPPAYEDGNHTCFVFDTTGVVGGPPCRKLMSGPYMIPLARSGDTTKTAMVWDNALKKWIPDVPPTSGLGSVDLTEITFVTAARISGTYMQVKTRTGKVYDPGTESDWTTVHTFPSFNT